MMLKYGMIALLSTCLVLAGCTTTRAVPLSTTPAVSIPAVKPGESVRITLKSGEVRRLKVTAVDAGTLTGTDLDVHGATTMVQLDMMDVQLLEARRTSPGRTTGLVVGLIAGLAALTYGGLLAASCGIELDDCGD